MFGKDNKGTITEIEGTKEKLERAQSRMRKAGSNVNNVCLPSFPALAAPILTTFCQLSRSASLGFSLPSLYWYSLL